MFQFYWRRSLGLSSRLTESTPGGSRLIQVVRKLAHLENKEINWLATFHHIKKSGSLHFDPGELYIQAEASVASGSVFQLTRLQKEKKQ